MQQLRQRALELALEGLTGEAMAAKLIIEFPDEYPTNLDGAISYVLTGDEYSHLMHRPDAPPQSTNPPQVATVARNGLAAGNKAKGRKTMIMLKVNYKNADEGAVTDCLTDLQHYCNAKGIDYLTCEVRSQQHFINEMEG